jgi:hypothetical protein
MAYLDLPPDRTSRILFRLTLSKEVLRFPGIVHSAVGIPRATLSPPLPVARSKVSDLPSGRWFVRVQ